MTKLKGKVLMTAAEIDLVLARMAAEILEKMGPGEDFAIIGIRRLGVHLAERLCSRIALARRRSVPLGVLDITLYRDDLTTVSNRPMLRETCIDFDINDRSLVLVDDVLYTGRTIRAALDGLMDMGRPRRVQLAVLIDRGHRELPIQADYVGKVVQTDMAESVEVYLRSHNDENVEPNDPTTPASSVISDECVILAPPTGPDKAATGSSAANANRHRRQARSQTATPVRKSK